MLSTVKVEACKQGFPIMTIFEYSSLILISYYLVHTDTHCFTLYTKGRLIRVLEWNDLEALARAGMVDWPNISEQEIKDRSKGDYLSKGIVVLQTTWFCSVLRVGSLQTNHHRVEVATFAFSTLIWVIYYLALRCSMFCSCPPGGT
jgi:hypothetical protein